MFAGASATGKSTLACAFHLKGYELLSDEISCLHQDGDEALLRPGPAEATLWPDVVAKLAMPQPELAPVRKGVNKAEALGLPEKSEPEAVPVQGHLHPRAGRQWIEHRGAQRAMKKVAALTAQGYPESAI